jgi:hypothetical protein
MLWILVSRSSKMTLSKIEREGPQKAVSLPAGESSLRVKGTAFGQSSVAHSPEQKAVQDAVQACGVALLACAQPEDVPSFVKVGIGTSSPIRTTYTRLRGPQTAVAAQDRLGIQGPRRARLHVTA